MKVTWSCYIGLNGRYVLNAQIELYGQKKSCNAVVEVPPMHVPIRAGSNQTYMYYTFDAYLLIKKMIDSYHDSITNLLVRNINIPIALQNKKGN